MGGCLKVAGAVVVGVIALVVIIVIATSGGSSTSTPSVSVKPAVTHISGPVHASATSAPKPTVNDEAVTDAKNYLSTEPGFSEGGLEQQLEYDKFSPSDSDKAVESLNVDWNAQAADDARNYVQEEGSFSMSSLEQQLEFDKFTSAQADYGANAALAS
jgi:hypothetical protein